MKIKDWIIFGVFALVATASTSLGAEPAKTVQENFTQLEGAIQSAKDQVASAGMVKTIRWTELETFQTQLWRSMALDPSIVAPVPVNQVPKNLFSAELNADLEQKFSDLKKNSHAKEFHVETEFNQYVATVERIMAQRKIRQFPVARGIAKRGTLDDVYAPLSKKLGAPSDAHLSVPAIGQIEDRVHALKDQIDETPSAKETAKKEVFANGNHFIWYMVVAMFGFFLGLAGYRMHPDFFHKFLNQFDSNTPTATTHSAGANKLDYARWLRELEEILSRLKSSQLTLERRIEDIVQNSEKISQHSLSLYADPRIKNEANLEYRMSTLLREVQHQFDQSQRLQAGDRVQVNLMLEHCLKLCDAVESDTVHYDRTKSAEHLGNTRSA
jgi:hypothetical protein